MAMMNPATNKPEAWQLEWHLLRLTHYQGRIWRIKALPTDAICADDRSDALVHLYDVQGKTVTLINAERKNGEYHRFTEACVTALGFEMKVRGEAHKGVKA